MADDLDNLEQMAQSHSCAITTLRVLQCHCQQQVHWNTKMWKNVMLVMQ